MKLLIAVALLLAIIAAALHVGSGAVSSWRASVATRAVRLKRAEE